MDFMFGEEDKVDGHGDSNKAVKFIQWIQRMHEALQDQSEKSQAKYKICHDKHLVDHQLQVGDQVWLYISKDRLNGEGKKLKPIRYGPFKIVESIRNNAFRLDLTPYMCIQLVVNVENMKLYEPPMIIDLEEDTKIPIVDDFAPEYMNELQEDTILDRNILSSRCGDVEYIRVGLKGIDPSKARWMEIKRVRELYPHLISA